ncbi:hypothetical protein Tco_0580730 [Tanacetum coccineum]
MIGCEVMRTLTSVEIEIMLILGLPCCLSNSRVRCLESADGAQSPRVPVPLPEDPYEAIRQAYLDGTDTESEPFEDLIDIETPELPLTVAPPTSLPESTPPILVHILRRTMRMAVRVPPARSSGLSASIAEVTTMSESVFRKRFRSSYESLPSVSPLDLPSWKRYRGTSELVEDSEEDDDEEDKEIKESLDSDSRRGEAVPEGQQQVAPVVRAAVSAPLGLGYGALRRRELALEGDRPTLTTWTDPEDGMVYIDVPTYPPPAPPVQTPPSPQWTSDSLPISPLPSVVPSPVSSPMIPLTAPSLGGLIHDHAIRLEELSLALFERYDRDIGELFTRTGAVREEILSQRYQFRSLKYEQERVAVTFGAIWRPVLALESWVGQTDAQRAALWHAINDMQGENQDLRLQLVEERLARLELDEVVDSMRKGQEPRGGT